MRIKLYLFIFSLTPFMKASIEKKNIFKYRKFAQKCENLSRWINF